MDIIVYEREKLYEEVWTEPVQAVAERYGVSGVALAKNCRKLEVPLPKRGHWAKVKAGKQPRRPALRKLAKGKSDRIVVQRWRSARTEPPEGLAQATQAIERAVVTVPGVLSAPHKLVEKAERSLRRAKPKNGLLARNDIRCLDIRVSLDSLDRALRIADALIKHLEQQGEVVEVRMITPPAPRNSHSYGAYRRSQDPDYPVTGVTIDSEWITFSLFEEIDSIPGPDPKPERRWLGREEYIYTPRPTYTHEVSGRLRLSITSVEGLGIRSTWGDATKQRLEDCVSAFSTQLSIAAAAIRLKREERERLVAERAEEKRLGLIAEQEERERVRIAEQQLRLEAERERELLAEVTDWRRAQDVRAYVGELQTLMWRGDFTDEERDGLRERLDWAKHYADRIDPLPSRQRAAQQDRKHEALD